MKTKPTIILAGSMLFLIMPILALTEEPLPMPGLLIPGTVEGTGTYFEITDSEYLNVSLQSTEEITLSLESIPKTISLHVEASTLTNSTGFTIGGLEPNTTYYKFEDSYKNEAVFISDSQGSYTWTQDLFQAHHIWFQPEDNGTVFLPEDCTSYGIWDDITSTCTLTQDLTESVEITANNITLDCAGHGITGITTGYGIYLSNKKGISVKNCVVSKFSHGVYLYYSNDNILKNNNLFKNSDGIYLYYSRNNTLTSNIASNNSWGIHLTHSFNNVLGGNTANSNKYFGIYLLVLSDNTLIDNIANSNNRRGIYLLHSDNNILKGNTTNLNTYHGILLDDSNNNTVIDNNIALNNYRGIHLSYSSNNKIYHNNFIDNYYNQPYVYSGTGNLFDDDYPSGGNYWSDYTGQDQYSGPNQDQPGSDGIGDTPHTFTGGQDRYPFMEESGWKIPHVVDIQLAWSQNQDPDFESYRIFRDITSGIDTNDTLVAVITDQTQTTFLDENLPTDTVFYYRIFVFDQAGFFSGSNEMSTE